MRKENDMAEFDEGKESEVSELPKCEYYLVSVLLHDNKLNVV